jgi:hypothetical protein
VEQLEAMGLNEILRLKFKGDRNRLRAIRNWIDGRKLRSYITDPTVQKEIAGKIFRALVVVIIGSRQILVREMDRSGKWVSEFQLAK